MRYTDRKTQKREKNRRRDTRHEITLTERHREEKKTEETRAMRYTDRKTQRREENRRDTRHEIH